MSNIKIIGQTGDYPVPSPWILKPVKAFRIKLLVYFILLSIVAFISALSIDIARSLWFDLEDKEWFALFLIIYGVVFCFFAILTPILIHIYVNNFEYQVHGTEIVVKKGLFNITENHVPFSNVTNISLRKGPLDRLFGIGSIIIHTAGEKRGTNTKIKMEGIMIVKEVGYYILNEIKNVESFLNTLTLELPKKREILNSNFWHEFLNETKSIKSNLRK
jgi:membrane protein YdbS with pleckstrin-like domain